MSPRVILPGKKSRFGQQKTWSSLLLPSGNSGEEGKGQVSCVARLHHPVAELRVTYMLPGENLAGDESRSPGGERGRRLDGG